MFLILKADASFQMQINLTNITISMKLVIVFSVTSYMWAYFKHPVTKHWRCLFIMKPTDENKKCIFFRYVSEGLE